MRANALAVFSLVVLTSACTRGFTQSECLDEAGSQGTWTARFTLLDQNYYFQGTCPTEVFTIGLPQVTSGCAPGCTCTGGFNFGDTNPDIPNECQLSFSQSCTDGVFKCQYDSLSSATEGYAVCIWISAANDLPPAWPYDCRYGGTWTKRE
jgi:hypothetical protein